MRRVVAFALACSCISAAQLRPPAPPKNLRIVKGPSLMADQQLQGLTVVLLDSAVALKHEPAINLALEAFIALREIGGDVRIFSVTDKLIELREIPESFGSVYAGPSRLSNAVNRVNITRPRRIVVLTGEIDATLMLGFPRDGTIGYLWVPDPQRASVPIDDRWSVLACAAAGVVHEMMRVEKEKPDGLEAEHVR
jgi:hypothetical protein